MELLLEAGAASRGAASGDGRRPGGGDEGLEGGEGGGFSAGVGRSEVGGAVAMSIEEGVKGVGATGGELPVDGAVVIGAGVVGEELFSEVAGDGGRGGFVVSAVKLVGDEVKAGGEVGAAKVGGEESVEVGEEAGNGLEGWARRGE